MTIEQLCKLSWEELQEWDEKKIEEHFAAALKVTRPPPKSEKVSKQGDLIIPDGPIKPPLKKSNFKDIQAQGLKLQKQFAELLAKQNAQNQPK